MPATWRPLPAPVPSPRNQPRRKRTEFSGSSGAAVGDVEGLIDLPRSGQVTGMGLARVDDALELGIRQQSARNDCGRQMRPVGRFRGCHRRHRHGLHQLGRMGLRIGNKDRLQAVFFIKRLGDTPALGRTANPRSRRRVRWTRPATATAGSRMTDGRWVPSKVGGTTGRRNSGSGGGHQRSAASPGYCCTTQSKQCGDVWRHSRRRWEFTCIFGGLLVDHGQARVDGRAVLGIDRAVDRGGEHHTASLLKLNERIRPGWIVRGEIGAGDGD